MDRDWTEQSQSGHISRSLLETEKNKTKMQNNAQIFAYVQYLL